ncbi:MAG: proline--tRNA ligase [Chlamydiae bacterium]|jgi:prolyl-tRNA synthetase|nr:proline--tRNA ligase [Chlamydiota bacterium]
MSKETTAVTPIRKDDFPGWYQSVLHVADLAEHAPVRGCMVIKPNGYAIWEVIQSILDKKFKLLGVKNAYFPLLIPLSFLEKEAEHIEGFAKESAVVTHTRLEKGSDGKLIPTSPLEEPLIIRPTSETIIGASFAKWIESYRDLPMKINQWCNVMRWEMRPRLFLRTSEFLWQEGHTAHASMEEAQKMSLDMLNLYADFAENYLAIPVVRGEKSEGERFPGAMNTYTFEAMMQDGKALQMGTAHFMGTNFSKASDIQFLSKDGVREYAHTTSWGVTTRMIGALVMVHGDDNGVILPPRVAPHQIVIIPFLLKEGDSSEIINRCYKIKEELESVEYFGRNLSVVVDDRDLRAGEKSWDAIKKGYPIRIEIGSREIKEGRVPLFLRTKEKKEALSIPKEELVSKISSVLDQIHSDLYAKALSYREENTVLVSEREEFEAIFRKEVGVGRFVVAPFKGDKSLEAKIQKDFGVTIRCIPHNLPPSCHSCLFTKQSNASQVIFAKSY